MEEQINIKVEDKVLLISSSVYIDVEDKKLFNKEEAKIKVVSE